MSKNSLADSPDLDALLDQAADDIASGKLTLDEAAAGAATSTASNAKTVKAADPEPEDIEEAEDEDAEAAGTDDDLGADDAGDDDADGVDDSAGDKPAAPAPLSDSDLDVISAAGLSLREAREIEALPAGARGQYLGLLARQNAEKAKANSGGEADGSSTHTFTAEQIEQIAPIDSERVKALAEELGVPEEAARRIVSEARDTSVRPLLGIVQQTITQVQNLGTFVKATEFGRGAQAEHRKLANMYPELASEEKYRDFVRSRSIVRAFEGHMEDGVDMADAAARAIRDAAKAQFGDAAAARKRSKAVADRKNSLAGTPESGKGRAGGGLTPNDGKPKSIDEAADLAFDQMKERAGTA